MFQYLNLKQKGETRNIKKEKTKYSLFRDNLNEIGRKNLQSC